jgi:putative transposase
MAHLMDPCADEIIRILDDARRLQREGYTFDEVLDMIGVDELTFYRYQADYGALEADQIRRLCKLEAENRRLRRAISQLMLDKLQLEERSWNFSSAAASLPSHA